MSTTVRIVCEVEVTVDTWGDKGNCDDLARQAVREGITKIKNRLKEDLHSLQVKEVKFVVHSIPWDGEKQ